jgi:hypothetical protein
MSRILLLRPSSLLLEAEFDGGEDPVAVGSDGAGEG